MTPAEYACVKAAAIGSEMMREYAVPKAMVEAMMEAIHREFLADAHTATASLPIGVKNLERVAEALAALRKRTVG
jgi:hypothetical protein